MTKPALRSVPSELPDPPYPADTKANGWKPEFDIRRIKQSTTWKLADPKVRNVLLRLWLESWEEIPCGSFENNDELIAATIDVELEWFTGYRKQIMRGWILHSDGRLYLPYITNNVRQMLETRKKASSRVREWRAKKALENTECNALPTSNQHVSNAQEQEQEQEQRLVVSVDTTCETPGGISPADPVPYKKIQELWSEILPELPQPVKLTVARKAHIRARWREDLTKVESWAKCFRYVRESRFLMGRVDNGNGRKPFQCTFDWIIKQENLCKLYEGKYHG